MQPSALLSPFLGKKSSVVQFRFFVTFHFLSQRSALLRPLLATLAVFPVFVRDDPPLYFVSTYVLSFSFPHFVNRNPLLLNVLCKAPLLSLFSSTIFHPIISSRSTVSFYCNVPYSRFIVTFHFLVPSSRSIFPFYRHVPYFRSIFTIFIIIPLSHFIAPFCRHVPYSHSIVSLCRHVPFSHSIVTFQHFPFSFQLSDVALKL